MLTIFGYLALALAFLVAVYGLVAIVVGLVRKSVPWVESARLAQLVVFVLLTLSIITLVVLLLRSRFDVTYIYSVTSRDMPAYLKITALWGGQSGSLLFWSWLLAGFCAVFSMRPRHEERDIFAWALLVTSVSLVFFLSLNLFLEIPFERFWHLADGSRVTAVFPPAGAWPLTPGDGQGLNPLLRHPGMIWHPPALYLGFVGFLIPFALAVGSMAVGRTDRRWIEISRPWILFTWVFLTLGLVLGMRWAYDILGWGGYWGWDPVEIAALMPWLSATALLHTALLQKRRDGFKRWNLVLALLTYVLVIFGTFITRSGLLSSVHSFADSEVGVPMFIYLSVFLLVPLFQLIHRWQGLKPGYEPEFTFSREVLTLFTNLVLLSILMVCFLGVIYPLVSELLTDTQVTVGPAWYQRITGPLFTILLLLVGICPLAVLGGTSLSRVKSRLFLPFGIANMVLVVIWLLGGVTSIYALAALWLAIFAVLVIVNEYISSVVNHWRNKPGKIFTALIAPFARNRQRYGGLLVHLGIVLIGIGIIGIEGLQQETQVTLAVGESVTLAGYDFRFDGLDSYNSQDGRNITEAVLVVNQHGEPIGALYPQRDVYIAIGMSITQPGIRSTLAKDIYAILIDWQPVTLTEATFRIFINPLVNWMWVGTGVLTLGVIIAGWPTQKGKAISQV